MAVKWDAAAIIAGIVAIVGGAVWLGSLQSDINNLDIKQVKAEIADAKSKNVSIPSGIIAAFNTPSSKPCPNGWKPFKNAQGRFLMGAGKDQPSFEDDTLGALGGIAAITISEDNLPSHDHRNGEYAYILKKNGSGTTGTGTDKSNSEPNIVSANTLVPFGNSSASPKPIEIIPPFVALYYCEKV